MENSNINEQLKAVLENGLHSEPTILIVDDNDSCRLLLARALERGEFKYCLCKSGEQMIKRICDRYISLVITDLDMAGIDGLEIANILKASDIPCIMVSNHSEHLQTQQGIEEKNSSNSEQKRDHFLEDVF